MEYRREIDGLRAVAVVPVVLFHAGVETVGGGFAGVDVFFVISGFLITSLILHERAAGAFTLAGFYERRARRILPALLLVILVCVPFAYLWMLPEELGSFNASLLGALLSGSNFVFYFQSGYFDQAAELKPLLHTWSLGVEEQFYILFPLLFLFLLARGRTLTIATLAGLIAASFFLAQLGGNLEPRQAATAGGWSWWATPSYGFFLLPTRAWELLLGSLLAVMQFQRGEWFELRRQWLTRELASLTGLGLMLYAFVAFDEATPFPSVYTLVPTIGAALVIAFARQGTLVYRLLASRPFVATGLISYSLYLWHHPLFAFARIWSPDALGTPVFLALAVVAVLLAALTWWVIERPFRNRAAIRLPLLIGSAAGASALLVAFFVAGVTTKGFAYRFDTDEFVPKTGRLVANHHCRRDKSEAWNNACVYGDGEPRVAIIGDSHARSIVKPLAAALSTKGLAVVDMHVAGCLPVRNFLRANTGDRCRRQDDAFDYLLRTETIDTVVIVARWATKFENSRFNNLEGGIEFGSDTQLYPDLARIGRSITIEEALAAVVQELAGARKKVVLVYPIPEVGWDVPPYMAKLKRLGMLDGDISTSYVVFLERNRRVIEALDAIPDALVASRVHPKSLFCNTVRQGRCMASIGLKALYSDTNHLNGYGASFVAETIASQISPAALQTQSGAAAGKAKGAGGE